MSYGHLSFEDRYYIEIELKAGRSMNQIAKALGVSERHGWSRFDVIQPMYLPAAVRSSSSRRRTGRISNWTPDCRAAILC